MSGRQALPSKTKASIGKATAKQRAFLIAVKQRRERTRVYAVLALSADEALSAVREMAADGVMVEMAGQHSKSMARSLKLVPGEMRLL